MDWMSRHDGQLHNPMPLNSSGLAMSISDGINFTAQPTLPNLPAMFPSPIPPSLNHQRRPFAIASSGGGFRAMTASMGMHRALLEEQLLGQVTHMSGVSGSSWFLAAAMFGRGFAAQLGNLQVPLETLLQETAANYTKALQHALATGKLSMKPRFASTRECGLFGRVELRLICSIVLSFFGNAPALDHLAFTEAFLPSFGPNISTIATASRLSLHDKTVLFNTALLNDVWVTPTGRTEPARVRIAGGLADNQFPAHRAVPAAYAISPTPSDPVSNIEGRWEPAELTASHVLQDNGSILPLALPPNPTAVFLAAASSAAAAFLASPSEGDSVLRTLKVPAACAAAGLQELAVPIGNTFRLADPYVTDNTGAAAVLARMQRDCRQPRPVLDCQDSPRFTLVVLAYFGNNSLHADVNELFTTSKWGGPSAIFAGSSPSWHDFTVFPTSAESSYHSIHHWAGIVRTVDNVLFGVRSGDDVRLQLIILSGSQVTGFGDQLSATSHSVVKALASRVSGASHDVLTAFLLPAEIVGIKDAELVFRNQYSRDALLFTKAIRSILSVFMK